MEQIIRPDLAANIRGQGSYNITENIVCDIENGYTQTRSLGDSPINYTCNQHGHLEFTGCEQKTCLK